MDQRTKYKVAGLLDAAVAKSGETEFQRLTAGLTSIQRASSVDKAANSVNRVQQLAMPKYEEELVALFYAVRFHLSHVNLAYSMITRMVAMRDRVNFQLTDTGRLHIVDFGCGTMVMRFGVILAVADALERGQNIEEVHIDSIDPNIPMVNIGVKIWNEFLTQVRFQVQDEPSLRWIREAIDRLPNPVPTVQNITLNKIQAHQDADIWLSAIHIVYGGNFGNEGPVREDLARITSAINPSVGFITCHGRNIEIVRRISPFDSGYEGKTERPNFQFSNQFLTPLITKACMSWGYFPQNWRVFWQWDKNPENTTCLIYRRKES